MDCFHRFHVMRCDDNLDKMKCVTYPCVGSPTPARKPCTLRKPKPFCSRCGRSEPAPLPCGRVPRCFQPCNKCIAKHNACRGKKKRKLKNKKTNTDCILVPPIPKCMKRRKKKRTRFETHDIRSPCSILSLQNKRGLVNPHPGQHRHCRKYYPLHPQICCDKYLNRSDCHRPKSCSPCRKNIATCTSAAIEPKCVQIRKKMNLAIGGSCNVAPTCDSDTAVAQCNNDETLKCTTVSKGCMCEPGCCDELICNLKSAPCQRPYCEDAPCQAGVVSPCFNDPPCKVAETCYRPTCYDDPLCENQKDGPCYNRPKCFENQSCETEKVPPCYRPKCLDDPPCKATEFDPCPYPKCIRDLACKRDKVPPCHRLKCLDHPPCIVDAYRPCQRPPKKRNKRTNTKAISKCWKLKKLPKLRRVKKKICSKKIKNECCAEDVLCGKRNSKSSVCDCLRSLRTRSLTCCATGKQTQVSTIMDSCLYNPCQRPNIITKISCNSSSMRNLGLMQSCFPNRVKFLDDCGMSPCGDLPGCYLYRKEKCIKKCEQHKKRQRCCKCILTCSVAILCAPCFLVALSYWLIKYVCSSCYENNDCNEVYPCEMPSGDIYYSVPGLDKNCHGKYIVDKPCNYKCPILDDETLIINGCEQKCMKKVSFEQPCNYNLCKVPCVDGYDERCIQNSRWRVKKSHPDPGRRYNLYYVDDRGWVIKPVSGGGDCITEPFLCNSPGPFHCPSRRANCPRPETIVLFKTSNKLRNLFNKAKCGCMKVLPCSLANALECSYTKATGDCMKHCDPYGSRNIYECCKKSRNTFEYCKNSGNICKCPRAGHSCKCSFKKAITTRASEWVKGTCRKMDEDRDKICEGMMKRVNNPMRRSFLGSCWDIIRSFCKVSRYILCTCFCCPFIFCFYCCHDICRRICCCLFF